MNKLGIVSIIFLQFKNQVKLYHWKTDLYARHVASGDLEEKISELIDRFIEVLQGSRNKRLEIDVSTNINISLPDNDSIINFLTDFNSWLTRDDGILELINIRDDPELLNIRDEMVSLINKTLYLFSLK